MSSYFIKRARGVSFNAFQQNTFAITYQEDKFASRMIINVILD